MDHTMDHLQGTNNMGIIALSYIIAVAASYVALDLVGRVSAAKSRNNRMFWLISGAFFMGFGIWSMHFVGMLAFQMSEPVSYDSVWVVISIVIAVMASFIKPISASEIERLYIEPLSKEELGYVGDERA